MKPNTEAFPKRLEKTHKLTAIFNSFNKKVKKESSASFTRVLRVTVACSECWAMSYLGHTWFSVCSLDALYTAVVVVVLVRARGALYLLHIFNRSCFFQNDKQCITIIGSNELLMMLKMILYLSVAQIYIMHRDYYTCKCFSPFPG